MPEMPFHEPSRMLRMQYGIGALLYSPAVNASLAKNVIRQTFGTQYSLAICLEDTIGDEAVTEAEEQLVLTLRTIWEAAQREEFFLPMIFIRVREPSQAERMFRKIAPYQSIFTGFIFPKYTVDNAEAYNYALHHVNTEAEKKIYMMPILESLDLIDLPTRHQTLERIREYIDRMEEYVLNVRVGGNDFSNAFALRRHADETIYDLRPVAQLLTDILTFFTPDYIVSGPVWEFFDGQDDAWRQGLLREMKLDRANGFVGKTVIHPNQIAPVNAALRVSKEDYDDAKAILLWDDTTLKVGKSSAGSRMNEVRTHAAWALRTLMLAETYGVIE